MNPDIETMIEQIIAAVPGDFVLDFTQGEWVCLYGLSPVGEASFILGRHVAPTLRESVTEAWLATREWKLA